MIIVPQIPQIHVMIEVSGENDTYFENDTHWIPFKDITQVTKKIVAYGDNKTIRFNKETRQSDYESVISQIKTVNASLLGIV